MMKQLGMRATPFDEKQIAAIAALAAENGRQVLLLDRGTTYPVDVLKDCELLVGYFPGELMKRAAGLKWLHTPSAGVDKLCSPALYPNDAVILTNSSGAFGTAIAEYLLTGLLMLMRHMPLYLAQQREHVWKKAPGEIGSVAGSTVTVVGLGDLGRSFAERCKALGATVRAVKRTMAEKPAYVDALYISDELMDAVAGADAVVLCLPGTQETAGMISADVLAAMKPGAYLLNAGRGSTVDQAALAAVLQSGALGGAMLDVAAVEPVKADDPLWETPNLILTPHISGSDSDRMNAECIFRLYWDNLRRYFAGEPLKNVVDRKRGY